MMIDGRAYQKEWQRRHRAKNPDYNKESCKRWRARNPGWRKTKVYGCRMPRHDLDAPIKYKTAHARCRYWLGKPSQYDCPCGKQARHWAFTGHDSPYKQMVETIDPRGNVIVVPASPYIFDYTAMCKSCHRGEQDK